jgi:hypothetical protein
MFTINPSNPLSPFNIVIPPHVELWQDLSSPHGVVAGPGSVAAFNDSAVFSAVVTLATKLGSFAGIPGTGQLAESTARDLAIVVGNLSRLGA